MTADEDQPRRRTSIFRFLTRAAAALAAGALATLLVAGAAAYFVRLPPTSRVIYTHRDPSFAADVMTWSAPGVKRIALVPNDPTLCAFDRELIPHSFHESTTACLRRYQRDTQWPAWGRVPDPDSYHSIVWAGVIQDARGWPFPALSSEWVYDASQSSRMPRMPRILPVSVAVDLSPAPAPRTVNAPGDLRAIPARPFWPGLLADTLLYAAAFAFVPLWIRSTRRFIRVRHNRCPRCAYFLAGQTRPGCPECGWKRIKCYGDAVA